MNNKTKGKFEVIHAACSDKEDYKVLSDLRRENARINTILKEKTLDVPLSLTEPILGGSPNEVITKNKKEI